MEGGAENAQVATTRQKRIALLVLDLIVNIAGPLLVYQLLHDRWGDTRALLASAIPPLLWSLGGFLRSRKVDAISMLALAGIALSFLAFLGGGSAQFLQLREKLVTLAISLAFLGSAAIGKPLIYPLARASMARESPESLADFDSRRNDGPVRHTIMVMTLIWGLGLLADFLLSVLLIYTLSIPQYLIVGPILGYGTIGGLTVVTLLYRRHRQRLRPSDEKLEPVAPATSPS